jgi:hypothetical protein
MATENDFEPPVTPNTPDKEEIEESVSDSESVTTEDVVDLITPRSLPAIEIDARLRLPAWFVVLTAYVFALGLGVFSSKC